MESSSWLMRRALRASRRVSGNAGDGRFIAELNHRSAAIQ
jgi:hypothetical protein